MCYIIAELLLKKKEWLDLLFVTALPLEMLAAIIIGAVIGYYLDKRYNTQPWLFLLFISFGIAAAARALWRDLKKLQQRQKDDGSGESQK